jgi:hypothetical protein
MTDRPNETSGRMPPRPNDAAIVGPPATDEQADTARVEDARREDAPRREAPRWGGFGWIVVIALILGGVAASPWWAPEIAPLLPWSAGTVPVQAPQAADDATSRRLDSLGQRLADAEQKLGQLGQRNASDGVAADAALAPLRDAVQRQQGELAALASRVAALEQRPIAPAVDPAILAGLQSTTGRLDAALATLEQRVGALASTNTSEAAASVDPALLLSLGQLRQTLQGSGPFAAELGVATTLAPLSDAAARGVPSLAILRQRFDGLAGSIADAGTGTAAPDGWSGQVLDRLRALVSVRRVGPGAVGDGPEAAVAQAESALAHDDLAGAVALLETLHGPAMMTAREWLETAHRRLAVEAALDKAAMLVTARLAAERKPAAVGGAGAKP